MAELNTDVRFVRGVGEARAKSLAKLGITDLKSLISYFPRAYEDRRESRRPAGPPAHRPPRGERRKRCRSSGTPPQSHRVRTVRRPSPRPDRRRNPEPAFRRRCLKFYAPFFLLLLISNPYSDRRNHLPFSRFIGFGSVSHCKSRAIPAACHYPNYGSSYHYYRFGREGAAGMEKSINFVTDNNNRSIWTRS